MAWTAIFDTITPRFVENPDSSLLCCMDSSVAEKLSVEEFQNIIRQRSIVITDCVEERLPFNLQGLGRLADVDHQMDIQGDTSSSACRNVMMNIHYRSNSPGSRWQVSTPSFHWSSQGPVPDVHCSPKQEEKLECTVSSQSPRSCR